MQEYIHDRVQASVLGDFTRQVINNKKGRKVDLILQSTIRQEGTLNNDDIL